ncbi:unnamed protein product [Brugia timori]|uniref:Uncharacterized protein n=1 Tax=Brugia timori TaxID=42155 RepID=A0A0R3QTX3_9BILA|nr:unnamed protein product [Brugia timori]
MAKRIATMDQCQSVSSQQQWISGWIIATSHIFVVNSDRNSTSLISVEKYTISANIASVKAFPAIHLR